MKEVVVQLGLITAAFLSGIAAVTVRIKAYNATGELDIRRDPFTLGTRVLLTCDVTGLPEGSEVERYRWFRSCTGGHQGRCEIHNPVPYYKAVKDTLLMDVTSWDQGGVYICFVRLTETSPWSIGKIHITVSGNPAPFLYTPTSLLPEHSVLTDVQQATGRNGQQWITCRSVGEGSRPGVWRGSQLVVNSSTANFATIELGTQHPNGLYHCLSAESQMEYFSLFLWNSVTPPTPTVSGQDTSIWTLTSPDGSQVERFIVEFECRVRNISFVEKYMSVSVSGGTGRVAASVSCFGGLGQLYRVKVWAVSGPNISPALVCMQDGQCREEGIAPATVATKATPTTAVNTVTLTTPTTAVNIATPTGPQPSSTGEHPTTSTFIGVGIGAGIFLLLVVSIVVVLIMVVVVVNKKAACKLKRNVIVNGNAYFNNTEVVLQELDMVEQGVGADNDDAHSCQVVGNNQGEGEDLLNFDVGYTQYVADWEVLGNHTMTPIPKVSSTAASATKVDAVHSVVDKNKKNGAKKETKVEPTVVSKEDLYALPMRKAVKITDKGGEVVVSGGVEEEEHYEHMVQLTYKTKTDSIP